MSANPTIFFAPLKVPLTDSRTGLMTREWYLFFQAIFLRIGGTSGPSNEELQQQVTVLQIAEDGVEQRPPVLSTNSGIDDVLAEIRAIRDLTAELTKRLDDIQQGTML